MNDSVAQRSRYALISVSDKQGIAEFASELNALGFSILSTGGTARALAEAGVAVTEVSEYTGFPEIMDGRVKTLHPLIYGGLLGRPGDQDVMAAHGMASIDVVVVNLYPFEQVTARPDCSLDEAIENIDIGGPAMVRAAAKNHARVAIVTQPGDYPTVLDELRRHGEVTDATRSRLAATAYAHTARYDQMITDYLSGPAQDAESDPAMPVTLNAGWSRAQSLRYGENPHQQAAFYTPTGQAATGLAAAKQLQGKELSYNNLADADAALECVGLLNGGPACVIVKHANPCGAAVADNVRTAYDRAYATDPVSSFGGIIAFNRELDGETASAIIGQQFVEVIIAPAYAEAALTALSAKPNVRVLQPGAAESAEQRLNHHRVAGGLLVQQPDIETVTREACRCVSERQPDDAQWADLLFAWEIARMVKSNAIVYARDSRTLGIGAGQMSRVDSARIAAWKAAEAGLSLTGSVMASDAFFPFRDSIDAAADQGITAIVQPGGSVRDDEVIAAANEHGMTMVFTGIRHFRH